MEKYSNYKINFGKHNGTKFVDIPKDYIKWLATIEVKDKALSEYVSEKSKTL